MATLPAENAPMFVELDGEHLQFFEKKVQLQHRLAIPHIRACNLQGGRNVVMKVVLTDIKVCDPMWPAVASLNTALLQGVQAARGGSPRLRIELADGSEQVLDAVDTAVGPTADFDHAELSPLFHNAGERYMD